MRPAGVILDLDGTMVDSAPDLVHAVNRMLTELGRPTVLLAAARSWIGNGVR
ncbi:MAG TPA: phosphoglycolate phosphatase, partial [Gammaproteobacteria bacterium]|nr:phosphoglycolate phosphatase [Gammaproteobacteria bacterium]